VERGQRAHEARKGLSSVLSLNHKVKGGSGGPDKGERKKCPSQSSGYRKGRRRGLPSASCLPEGLDQRDCQGKGVGTFSLSQGKSSNPGKEIETIFSGS